MREREAIKVAILLIAIGALMICCVFAASGFSPAKLIRAVSGYEETTAYLSEAFSRVRIEDVDGVIRVLPSADGCVLQYDASERSSYHVGTANGVLTIAREKSWLDFFGVLITAPKLTLYLPEAAYEELYVHTVSGSIQVENIDWGELRLETTSGGIRLSNVRADGGAALKTVSGGIRLESARAGDLSAQTVSGGIRLDGVDAGSLDLHTVSGSIRGALLSEKEFEASSVSGSVKVPESAAGAGICRASTTSGGISISVAE